MRIHKGQQQSSLAPLEQSFPRKSYDIVAFAASAGGLKAITEVLKNLPTNFPAAIMVVQHVSPLHHSLIPNILSHKTTLRVKQAEEAEPVTPGTVYIAPPNYHLSITDNKTLSLTQTERVHFVRPSADLLFDSVATVYKDRCIGVVLSGTGNDGAMGVQAIHNVGGTVIVQDEKTSDFSGMPRAAIHTGAVNFVLPLTKIASVLLSLISMKVVSTKLL